jgi:hypothetical protein
MVGYVRMPSLAARAALLATMPAMLAGCGSGHGSSGQTATAASAAAAPTASPGCAATAVRTLSSILKRVYDEGVSSERTVIARRLIEGSAALRQAVEAGDSAAATAAARGLLAQAKITDLLVMRGGRTLASVGGPAITPLHGTITGAGGAPVGTYVTSVWNDSGYLTESSSVAEGSVSLRARNRTVAGFRLPSGPLPAEGGIVLHGRSYHYASFPGEAYPSGALSVYLLRSDASAAQLCGSSEEETAVNAVTRVAHLIYKGEGGRRTLPQVHRVQHDQALLQAVARHEPEATRAAIASLLNQHIVRLRVSAGGHLLSDVGGPFVLAPVTAPLRLGGRTIGSFVLSIQDDEGYLRLARRLVGLRVLMYMGPRLVKNSLGGVPASLPARGSVTIGGQKYRVFTVHAKAFPSGPLRIVVFMPIPYT